MSLLPAVGVGLAMLLGADPVRWFVSSVPGLLCLTAGVLLNVAGYSWIGGIVRGVEADL